MFGKIRLLRWLIGAAVLAMAECASITAIEIALTVPAQAQFRDDGFPFLSRQRYPRSGCFFGRIFGPYPNPMKTYDIITPIVVAIFVA